MLFLSVCSKKLKIEEQFLQTDINEIPCLMSTRSLDAKLLTQIIIITPETFANIVKLLSIAITSPVLDITSQSEFYSRNIRKFLRLLNRDLEKLTFRDSTVFALISDTILYSSRETRI